MRLDHAELAGVPLDRIKALKLAYRGAEAKAIVAGMRAEFGDEAALMSSFGADAAVLLHMASEIDPDMPVLFVDTLMLFEETLRYQRDLADRLGLTNVQHLRPSGTDLEALDPDGTLHRSDPDACCVIRKVAPVDRALGRFAVVISGRKRYQTVTRAGLEVFEKDGPRLRVSPLAGWSGQDVRAYMTRHALPLHPLVPRGYPSIGCVPCTTPVAPGESERAGRWRGTEKVECGIHFAPDGRLLRAS
jgi:phosphoadenosine phosphosulfate reductase